LKMVLNILRVQSVRSRLIVVGLLFVGSALETCLSLFSEVILLAIVSRQFQSNIFHQHSISSDRVHDTSLYSCTVASSFPSILKPSFGGAGRYPVEAFTRVPILPRYDKYTNGKTSQLQEASPRVENNNSFADKKKTPTPWTFFAMVECSVPDQ
jgi:hypothetical protein